MHSLALTEKAIARPTPLRVAVVCDLVEEGWASMDLVGEMLIEHLRAQPGIHPARVRPPMTRRFQKVPGLGSRGRNADRLSNRFWDYPRYLRRLRGDFDVFHIVDHSYSQLVHELPAGRVVVTCHDLDTFRSVIEPERDPRPAPYRAMTRRILSGFRKAARVLCVSRATRDELLAHGLVAPGNALLVYNGVPDCFSAAPDESAVREAARLLETPRPAVDVLHIGSVIPRKRIDVLLHVVARVRQRIPNLRLIRVGGALTPGQAALASELGIGQAVVELPWLDRKVLAAVYRRVGLLLVTSEAEGFGLPVAEAMASGAVVCASDLPVLREVGGDAACYLPVADIRAWELGVSSLLRERDAASGEWRGMRQRSLAQASRFRWQTNAGRTAEVYRNLL